jgi:hypothetical protein
MSDHDSLAPLLGSLTSAFTQSRRPGAPQTGSVDRALGAAASLGLSLAILRLVVFCAKAAKRLETSDDPNQLSSLESAGNVWYTFMRNIIRRLLQEDSPRDSKGSAGIESDGAIITHQGSCHCESVHFEVRKSGVVSCQVPLSSRDLHSYTLCFLSLYSSSFTLRCSLHDVLVLRMDLEKFSTGIRRSRPPTFELPREKIA